MVRSSIAIGADQPAVAINSMDGKAMTDPPVPGFISTLLEQDAEKVRQRYWKVKDEVKAEKKVCSTLNLNLDLSLLQMLRPYWTAFLSILRGVLPLS
jgi:hypothetical protein